MLGCQQKLPMPTTLPRFDEQYRALDRVLESSSSSQRREKTVTVSVDGMPLQPFLRWLTNEAGVSVVASESLDGHLISIEVQDAAVSDVLALVSRRLGVQLTTKGGAFFLGDLRPEDRGVLVRKVRRLTGQDLAWAVETLLSEFGRSRAYPDGLVVVSDRVEVLGRVSELLDSVEAAPSDTWVVQLFLIQSNEGDEGEFGVDVRPVADLSASFLAASSLGDVQSAGSVAGSLSALLRASRTQTGLEVIADPLLLILDGSSGEFADGQRVPIARRSVSDQGTVTVSGFDFVQTGLQVKVNLREVGLNAARLGIDVELSDIVGFVADEAPITSRRALQCELVARSSGVYLVGSLRRDESRSTVDGIAGLVSAWDRDRSSVQVWLKAFRISGGYWTE